MSKPNTFFSAKRILFLGLLFVMALACGCTVYSGQRSGLSNQRIRTKVLLERGNYRIVQSHVEGYASCPHILFVAFPAVLQRSYGLPAAIGTPFGDPDLLERAMADLHSKTDMQGKPRILHNVMEEWTNTMYFGVYGVAELKISAMVLEFTKPGEEGAGEGEARW